MCCIPVPQDLKFNKIQLNLGGVKKTKILDTNGINPSQMDLSQNRRVTVHNENVQDEE